MWVVGHDAGILYGDYVQAYVKVSSAYCGVCSLHGFCPGLIYRSIWFECSHNWEISFWDSGMCICRRLSLWF